MSPSCLEDLIWKKLQSFRRWKHTPLSLKRRRWDFTFTVMSYNILSQRALDAHRALYRHCPPDVLLEDYRASRLVPEIVSCRSDIICLQEVEQRVFEQVIRHAFEPRGFGTVFKQKTGRRGAPQTDGCAILWNRNKFRLLQSTGVEMYDRKSSLLDRCNVGLIAALQPLHQKCGGDVQLHVATTHLLFNPRRGDVKLAQLRVLLAELERSSLKEVCGEERVYHPTVLCGDFNIEPLSPLHEFLCKGEIEIRKDTKSGDLCGQVSGRGNGRRMSEESLHVPGIGNNGRYVDASVPKNSVQDLGDDVTTSDSSSISENGGTSENSGARAFTDSNIVVEQFSRGDKPDGSGDGSAWFYHDLNLVPTYKFYPDCNFYTSVVNGVFHKVDHIFYNVREKSGDKYTEGSLRLLSTLSLLSEEQIWEVGGLPNAVMGSDHICLMSHFGLSFEH